MSERPRFRRPAMLSFEDAEKIEGDDDPATAAQVAMTSARALLGLCDEEFGPDAVNNIVAAIKEEGVDIVADLWERSPEFTLPGALWRLYLFNEWYNRDPLTVHQRYVEGLHAPFTAGMDDAKLAAPSAADTAEPPCDDQSARKRAEKPQDVTSRANRKIALAPDEAEVFDRVSKLMAGKEFGDLTQLLRDCALVMRILASGSTFGTTWIRTDKDRLANMVTRRAAALMDTATELDTAADRNEAGRLI